jgi:hypothetical protein
MPPSLDRHLARLRARYHQHVAALATVGVILRGSLVERFLPCGTPGCRCHADPPQLHGPYWQWSRRVQGKTVSRMLQEAQVRQYQEWIENGKHFDTIVREMHDLSAEIATLLLAHQRASGPSAPSATRRAKPRKSAAQR